MALRCAVQAQVEVLLVDGVENEDPDIKLQVYSDHSYDSRVVLQWGPKGEPLTLEVGALLEALKRCSRGF